MIGFVPALSAGFCAALASLSAKLAMSPGIQKRFWCDFVLQNVFRDNFLCQSVVIASRLFSFILVFIFNALMWTLFVKSLRGSVSSATATVTNTGSNFISTAILGCLLFGETLSMRWWFGTSLILTGLTLVHYNSEPLTEEHLDLKME
ncbi:transmembrane protein 42-like [Montipora capricornis]|uniref:transmembrane protein 42-like n=1 Tax=Montipora foliosa TaxID=591990 RepID=UPI0035F19CE1